MEYCYHEMEKTNIKYLIQWMTETQNCENVKVDHQESRITWHQNKKKWFTYDQIIPKVLCHQSSPW